MYGHVLKVVPPRLWIRHKYPAVVIDRNDHITAECTAREGRDSDSPTPRDGEGLERHFDRVEKHGECQRGQGCRIDFEE